MDRGQNGSPEYLKTHRTVDHEVQNINKHFDMSSTHLSAVGSKEFDSKGNFNPNQYSFPQPSKAKIPSQAAILPHAFMKHTLSTERRQAVLRNVHHSEESAEGPASDLHERLNPYQTLQSKKSLHKKGSHSIANPPPTENVRDTLQSLG
mmetsp:Transcript_10927/g.16589  ORF Transcript_10927/g.16589 Transcript_10927/m.16589 type:complete len:149 (-) Transcript_10927:636-1082(-)